MQARIVSVADTFDAMTTDRPYQKAMELDDALSRIKTFVGTRYDERVVDALVEACESGRINAVSTTRLQRPRRTAEQLAESIPPVAGPPVERPRVA
jgi:HD-GYP domain-containing protein (c-di-GMP phosphodiesterase class II)